MKDQVYRQPQSHIVDFAFTESVAEVFPDMIRRSVPGYDTIIPVTGLIAARHAGSTAKVVDLGCSLGATTQAVLAQSDATGLELIGIDNSEPMISRAIELNTDPRASFVLADVQSDAIDAHLEDAKVTILNFVLQFFEPATRLQTLQRIRQQMSPHGLLIVSEKVRHSDDAIHKLFDDTHLAWKRANGYSELEVAQKRSALENVMKVDDVATHQGRFREAGFSNVIQWYQCMNWASFLVHP